MPDFDNNGATIHYELIGSGPPLLMLAGLASDGASWGPLTPLLAERFRLILIDNRGSGRTRCPGPIAVPDMADDAAALLDRLDIAQASIIGHSLGGGLGLSLAARHPDRVKRLVTMATGAVTPRIHALFADLLLVYRENAPETYFRLLFQWLFSEPFFADPASVTAAAEASAAYPYRQSPDDFARQLTALQTAPRIELSTVRCPVLALAAGRDLLGPPDAVRALHAPIPDHRVAIIETAAHSIHWEAPEAVAQSIVDFVG